MRAFGPCYFLWCFVLLTKTTFRAVDARVGEQVEIEEEDHQPNSATEEEDEDWLIKVLPQQHDIDKLNIIKNDLRKLEEEDTTSQCPSVYPDPNSIKLLLSKEFFINYVNHSLYLADIIKAQDFGPIEDLVPELEKQYERVDVFSDIDDQALIVKTFDTGICFSAFQASDRGDRMIEGYIGYLLDQWHNINPFTMKVKGTDCKLRKGTFDAYNTTYKLHYRRAMDACIASCGDKPCELVLAGDSQGGAVAMAAAIDLTQLYDPYVITFAAPKAISDSAPCTILNTEKHFRFVNTDASGNYDIIPNQINVFKERHTGWTLLLDDVNFPLSSPGLDDSRDRCPGILDLHEYTTYKARVQNIIDRDCFPVAVGGWPEGHYCRFDDECEIGYCQRNLCRRGLRK